MVKCPIVEACQDINSWY